MTENFRYRLDDNGKVLDVINQDTGRVVLAMRYDDPTTDPAPTSRGPIRSSAELRARVRQDAAAALPPAPAPIHSNAALRSAMGMPSRQDIRRRPAPAAAAMRQDAPATSAAPRSAAALRSAGLVRSSAELRALIRRV